MRHIICLIITSIGLNAQPRPFPVPNRIPLGGRVPVPTRPVNFGGPSIKGEHVKLINGDVFRGEFTGFNKEGQMLWSHPAIQPTLHIDPLQLATLTLGSQNVERKDHIGNIQLINGDKLSGDFVSLSEDKLVLNTWYAGKLTLNR